MGGLLHDVADLKKRVSQLENMIGGAQAEQPSPPNTITVNPPTRKQYLKFKEIFQMDPTPDMTSGMVWKMIHAAVVSKAQKRKTAKTVALAAETPPPALAEEVIMNVPAHRDYTIEGNRVTMTP
jgi:FtsZ-interacting cell division protein ZipA